MSRLLVLNVGSSSLKAALFEVRGPEPQARARVSLELARRESPEARLDEALARLGALDALDAVGHRIVHGGREFTAPVAIDAQVEAVIERLAPLAPLHQLPALRVVRAARQRLSGAVHVAVFDTAFHAGRSPASMRYALPDPLVERHSLFRFGFHGLAHASLVEGLAQRTGQPPERIRAVTLQLGQGCSACAVEGGRSIETSMGFTPLEGLVMGTRAGDVDPGVLLHLLRSGMDAAELEALLLERSGLLGLAGTADMRRILAAVEAGDARAERALEIFVRRIVLVAGAYLTLLGGRAPLVFGGGIGENAARVREQVVAGLRAWAPDVYVIPTDEERLIARLAAGTLAEPRA